MPDEAGDGGRVTHPQPSSALPGVRALARALQHGELRAEAVAADYLARLAAVNPMLNALVHPAADVLERARAADLARARGEPCGALHGVPFTVKDWIEVAGLPCDAGFEERRGFMPTQDATAVQRLRTAGGIVLGKTKTGGSANALHPACGNPRAAGRTPGASSSGEAALAAARASPFGLGSDSGGSIRWPAHCCGVAGLKPSHGRVPNTGHFPPIGMLADPRTVIGPIAPTVDDLAFVFALIAGPDDIDTSAVPVPVALAGPRDGAPLRIAWFAGWDNERRGWGPSPSGDALAVTTDATGNAALQAAVAALQDAGHVLVEAVPPHIEDARAITEVYWARPQSISLRSWRPPPASPAMQALDTTIVEHSLFAWERLRRAMLAFMREFDVLLCPAAPRVAPMLGTSAIDDYAYTLPFSLTGQPVVSLQGAWSEDGMPANVQVIAPRFHDLRALRVAREIEDRCGAVR